MLLKNFFPLLPILLQEGGMAVQSCIVGGNIGAGGKITEIEVTAKGVIVRREEGFSDLYFQGAGSGELLTKSSDAKAPLTMTQGRPKNG